VVVQRSVSSGERHRILGEVGEKVLEIKF